MPSGPSPLHQHGLDATCGHNRILVFPDAYDEPSGVCKALRRLDITPPIALDLVAPELCVRPRGRYVDRARVPPAAVDEDRNPGPQEDKVGLTAEILKRLNVYA